MVIPVSTAPAAKAWLYAQMVANTTLAATATNTFQLSYATVVATPDSPDDMVWLDGVANRVVKPFALVGDQSQYSTAEEYDLVVNISCFRAGEENDADATKDPGYIAEARAFVLAGAVETIQRTDPTMGGNVVTSRPNQSSSDVDWDDAGNGRVATLQLSFHCFATI